MYNVISKEEDRIGRAVVDAAFKIHKEPGPGLLEKVNEVCFYHILSKMGFKVARQVDIPIVYDGIVFEEGLRPDVLVDDLVICELKALENVNPVREARLLSLLKLTDKRPGCLIDFNVPLIKNGIKRMVL